MIGHLDDDLGALLDLDGTLFVAEAYRRILGRPVDPDGLAHHLSALRDGRLSKMEIVLAFADTMEGQAVLAGSPLPGLERRRRWLDLGRIPILGRVLGILRILRPWQIQDRHRDALRTRLAMAEARLADLETTRAHHHQVQSVFDRLAPRVDELELTRAHRHALEHLRQTKADVGALIMTWRRIDHLRAQVEVCALADTVAREFARFESALSRVSETVASDHFRLQREWSEAVADLRSALYVAKESIAGELAAKSGRDEVGLLISELQDDIARKSDQDHVQELVSALKDDLSHKSDRHDVQQWVSALQDDLAGKSGRDELGLLADALSDRPTQADLASVRAGVEALLVSGGVPVHGDLAVAVGRLRYWLSGDPARYARFEEAFRGSETPIREHFAVYLPRFLDGLPAGTVLDMGCGRGEWLSLLAEQGRPARGIDINPTFVAACRSKGLDAGLHDLWSTLDAVPPGTLAGITMFQVIEHLPRMALSDLLVLMRRALCPGGRLLIETPDPRNVIVGASNFWTDPTHVAPLPSHTLEFLLADAGFTSVALIRRDPPPPQTADPYLTDHLTHHFWVAADYAVLAEVPK